MSKEVQQIKTSQKEAIAEAIAEFFVGFFDRQEQRSRQITDSDRGSAGNYPSSESVT